MASLAMAFDILARDKASKTFRDVGDAADDASKKIADSSDKASKGFGKGFGAKLAGLAKAGPIVAAAGAIGAAVGASIFEGASREAAGDKLAASLGLNARQQKRSGKLAGKLFADAYGGSLEEVNTAIGAVATQLGGFRKASDKELERASVKALDFAAIFDVEVARGAQIAGQTVKNGLASNVTEAFDLITAASQKVAPNLREDVLDAADEYGQFFNTLGIGGPEAFGLLVKGAEKGQFGIDKVGDSIKEFTIRSTDLSQSTKDAYKSIGVNVGEITNDILAGGDKAERATQKVIDGLLGMEDPGKRAEAAIALFGTPIEDLNVKDIPDFLKSLQSGRDELSKFRGASKRAGDTLNDNATTRVKQFRRQLQTGVVNLIGDHVLPALNQLSDSFGGEGGLNGVIKAARPILMQVGSAMIAVGRFIMRLVRDNMPLLKDIFRELGSIVKSVIELWKAISPIVLPIVKFLFKQIFNILRNGLKIIGGILDILVGIFTGDTERMSKGVRKIFDALFGKNGYLRSSTRNAVEALRGIWSGITTVFEKPINWIIENVLNKLVGGINTILKFVGKDAIRLPNFATIGGGSGSGSGSVGGRQFAAARGGIVPGYTPGRDVHRFYSPTGGTLDLSGGEPVMRPEFGRVVGNRWVEAANRAARTRGVEGVRRFLGGLRDGGIAPVPGPGNQHSGYGWASWAGDFPVPFGTPVRAWKDGIVALVRHLTTSYGSHLRMNHTDGTSSLYAHMSRIVANVGERLRAGQVLGYVGSTGRAYGDHLHFETMGGPFQGARRFLGRGLDLLADVPNPVELISGAVERAMEGYAKFRGSPLGQMVGKVPGKLAGMAADKAKSLLGSMSGFFGLSDGASGNIQNDVRALMLQRWDASQWAPLKALVAGESSWNPRALNPSSGAYGLFQALPASKYGTVGSDWRTNYITQARWGLGYIADRYGSPSQAYSTWLSRNPHWYGNGTRHAAPGIHGVGDGGAELVLSPQLRNFGAGGHQVLNPRQTQSILNPSFQVIVEIDGQQLQGRIVSVVDDRNRQTFAGASRSR